MILILRTGTAVEKRTFLKVPNLRNYLAEDSCQTQEELAESWGVTQQAILKHLEATEIIQEQGNWVAYDLKPRNVERRFFGCQQMLQKQNRKKFLRCSVTIDEKWVHYDNTKRRKSWVMMPGHASTSTIRLNIHSAKIMICICWDQLGVVYYKLLKPSEIIIGDRYRKQLMRLRRALKKKRPQYPERHDKVILQHNNARPHAARPVKTYLETLKWEVLPQPPYFPDVVPSDYPFFLIDGTRSGSSAFPLL